MGCSRPIAELGWEKQSHQIGQTGKVFLPRYILLLGFPVLCSICAQ
ncbi:MAG: FAD-binding protein [Dialister invisus]